MTFYQQKLRVCKGTALLRNVEAGSHWAEVRKASGGKLGYENRGPVKRRAAFYLLLVHFYHPEVENFNFMVILGFAQG